MLMAMEANLIAKGKDGLTFALRDAIAEQLSRIAKHIESSAERGSYMYYYDGVLYKEVRQILEESGYEITDIYATSNDIKLYTGVNICWY